MNINLLAFGQIAEMIGQAEFEISEIENTVELSKILLELYPALGEISYSIAVNKSIVHGNTLLKHGDTVALLPPFSGG